EYPGRQLTALNADPGPTRQIRMIVVPAASLRAPDVTVTVATLTAISVALSDYLNTRGQLGAEVTVAFDRQTGARNNFRNVGVDLHTDERDLRIRALAIAASLDERKRRNRHPASHAQGAVTAALPAPMLRAEIARYPLDTAPPTMSGNTVVSSVNRGAADLRLGGGSVRFTAGFPALSPFMALTHGVHGIGDTVTVSITAGMRVLPDIDRYEELLRGALADVARALGGEEFSGASASIP
ncbi:MAG: WS/DGAT domain-containing protein, partial [Rhodococcus fascians]